MKGKPWITCPVCLAKSMPPKSRVCQDCEALLEAGRRHLELSAKPSYVRLGLPVINDETYTGLHTCHIEHAVNVKLAKAFSAIVRRLAKAIVQESVVDNDKKLFPFSGVAQDVGSFQASVPNELRQLWEAIEEAIENADAGGRETGSSLIKGLATGVTSIDEFNEATIGPSHKRGAKR